MIISTTCLYIDSSVVAYKEMGDIRNKLLIKIETSDAVSALFNCLQAERKT